MVVVKAISAIWKPHNSNFWRIRSSSVDHAILAEHSYTVLCLLSRLYPIASEEWGGKSINIPFESESADSSTCPIMVSGLDDSLGGVEDAPLLRSVIVVVASVPWRAPEEWRMEGDKRGKSIALAPPCTIPANERVLDYYIMIFVCS